LILDVDIKCKTTKQRRKHHRGNPCDLRISKAFSDMTPSAQPMKEKGINSMSFKI
jgi:hypothetical protein